MSPSALNGWQSQEHDYTAEVHSHATDSGRAQRPRGHVADTRLDWWDFCAIVQLSRVVDPHEVREMPSAVPNDAEARLPRARMIDPRGHRFGAGLSAVLLVVAFGLNAPWLVAVALASIGASAAFGLRWSVYGAIWRRIVRVLSLPPTTPEHEYPPRFAQTLGQRRADPFAGGVRGWCCAGWLGPRLRRGRAAIPPRGHGLLPRLPVVLPALVGAGPRDPDLDTRHRSDLARATRPGADPLQVKIRF